MSTPTLTTSPITHSSTTPPTTNPSLPLPFSQSHPPPTLLTQGAEAFLYRTQFLSSSTPCALKYRPLKPYRHPVLDLRLTRHRILSEARTLVKLRREGIRVPGVLGVDVEGFGDGGASKGAGGWMMMEWVEGRTLKDVLVAGPGRVKASGRNRGQWEEEVRAVLAKVGRVVGGMHAAGVVHGDLTTSNLMLRPTTSHAMTNGHGAAVQDEGEELRNGEIVLIDFGLSAQTAQDEDRAVDLYVLERAFGSTHPELEGEFEEMLKAYRESYKGAQGVIKKLGEVRGRGRKRSMLG